MAQRKKNRRQILMKWHSQSHRTCRGRPTASSSLSPALETHWQNKADLNASQCHTAVSAKPREDVKIRAIELDYPWGHQVMSAVTHS